MSASPSATESNDTHEMHPHPPMPAVTDEAADTPTWVPVTGLVLFVLMVLYIMMRAAMAPPPPSATSDEAYGAEGAPPAAAPAEPGAQ